MSSSSSRRTRLLRAAPPQGEVVVGVNSSALVDIAPLDAPLATAADIVAAAERRAADIIAAAERRAAELVAGVEAVRDEARRQGYAEGAAAARAEVEAEFAAHLELVRAAAQEGKRIRDQIASQSLAVVARAVELAVRRIVSDWYDAHPESTIALCEEALRLAPSEQLLSVRVHPSIAGRVEAALGDLGRYVRPHSAVELGGCIVDLEGGTIDATLDARLGSLSEALHRAVGGWTP
jgi:flagellar assembly protein FliH